MNMERIKKLLSSEAVLFISLGAAVISMIFVPPSKEYIGYINFSVLILLLCLMGVVAAFRKIGVFNVVTNFLLSRTSSSRTVAFILMNLCFFSSMLVTNDVALITFVPLSISIAGKASDRGFLIKTTVIETAAANLGSMMTPIGNPQNLFIYSHYGLSAVDFVKTLMPVGIAGYIVLCLSMLMIKKEKLEYKKEETGTEKLPAGRMLIYTALFLVCLGAVAGFVNDYICLGIVVIALLLADRSAFKKIDYSLLLTFVCFFVFAGNISAIGSVREFISGAVTGREIVATVILSQIISNVPAAVMLSGFSDKSLLLLAGVNIGSFGTPVASLASLISFRFYSAVPGASKGKYMLFFTVYNFALLAFLMIVNWVKPF